jgi:hypothetical protein
MALCIIVIENAKKNLLKRHFATTLYICIVQRNLENFTTVLLNGGAYFRHKKTAHKQLLILS